MAAAVTTGLPPEFWEARDVLTRIRQQAQARRVAPSAVLAGVLARVATAVPPEVVTPELVGSCASINPFFAIVARSGGGKGASQSAASEWFRVKASLLRYTETTIGSGEGLAAAFAKPGKAEDGTPTTEIHTDSALIDIPEVDTISAIAGRSGSTTTSELRKGWDGAPLGFRNRSADRSIIVPAHSYRMAVTVGVQPERSGALLDEAAGGFPQRFVWFSATDPDAPPQPPAALEPFVWEPPTVPAREDGKRVLSVCATAANTITTAAVARLRGEGDALDGHALLARLKIGALLALLDGKTGVTEEDWRLAGLVMEESSRVRQSCVDSLKSAARASNLARAVARGEAEVETDMRAADVAIAKTKERVLLHINDKPIGAAAMRKRLSPKLRDYFDAAIDELEDSGIVSVRDIEYRGNRGQEIALTRPRGDKITTP